MGVLSVVSAKVDGDLVSARIATLFRTIRMSRGLNQQELSSILGVSQSAISKLEAGALQPSVVIWLRFCEIFGLRSDLPLRASLFNTFVASCRTSKNTKALSRAMGNKKKLA